MSRDHDWQAVSRQLAWTKMRPGFVKIVDSQDSDLQLGRSWPKVLVSINIKQDTPLSNKRKNIDWRLAPEQETVSIKVSIL